MHKEIIRFRHHMVIDVHAKISKIFNTYRVHGGNRNFYITQHRFRTTVQYNILPLCQNNLIPEQY